MMAEGDKNPIEIVKEKGLAQVTNTDKIKDIVNQVLDLNKEKVRDYKSGKTKLLGFFVGQAMKLSKGKANPKLLNQILIS